MVLLLIINEFFYSLFFLSSAFLLSSNCCFNCTSRSCFIRSFSVRCIVFPPPCNPATLLAPLSFYAVLLFPISSVLSPLSSCPDCLPTSAILGSGSRNLRSDWLLREGLPLSSSDIFFTGFFLINLGFSIFLICSYIIFLSYSTF